MPMPGSWRPSETTHLGGQAATPAWCKILPDSTEAGPLRAILPGCPSLCPSPLVSTDQTHSFSHIFSRKPYLKQMRWGCSEEWCASHTVVGVKQGEGRSPPSSPPQAHIPCYLFHQLHHRLWLPLSQDPCILGRPRPSHQLNSW